MPNISIPLVNNEFYHVFNRGVARNPIFYSKNDYEQAMLALSYYLYTNPPVKLSRFKELSFEQRELLLSIRDNSKLVEVISFCFMPNHFHLLLKQITDNGISTFISKFTNSYTRYFNIKHKRVGHLFQGKFKAVHIETDEQLIHLSRYIHINAVVSFVIPEKELLFYPWSSLTDYLNPEASFINSAPILAHFKSVEEYKKFVFDQIGYARELEKIKHLLIEND